MPAHCPLCESRALGRDSASARAWSLLTLGVGLLILSQVVFPATLPLLGDAAYGSMQLRPRQDPKGRIQEAQANLRGLERMDRTVFFLGVACALLGGLDVFLDRSRYCAHCGFRGRFPKGGGLPAAGAKHQAERTSRPAAPEREEVVAADQPVTPLLRMLRFKDEAKRSQAARTLRQLTGQDFGTDAEAWEQWWEQNKEAFQASRGQGGKKG